MIENAMDTATADRFIWVEGISVNEFVNVDQMSCFGSILVS